MKPRNPESGFTLIALMVIVSIMGIMLASAAQSWKMHAKREKEAELLFRGMQYKNAITRWYNPNLKLDPKGNPVGALAPTTSKPLRELKPLYEGDPNFPNKPRYLRQPFLDPITGEDFETLPDQFGNIVGVRSTSKEEPLKKGNFPEELKEFQGKRSYADWKFVYLQNPAAGRGDNGTPPPPIPPPEEEEQGQKRTAPESSGGFGGIMGNSPD